MTYANLTSPYLQDRRPWFGNTDDLRFEYEQTMAGFEMRRKLPNRVGWVIFRC